MKKSPVATLKKFGRCGRLTQKAFITFRIAAEHKTSGFDQWVEQRVRSRSSKTAVFCGQTCPTTERRLFSSAISRSGEWILPRATRRRSRLRDAEHRRSL